MYKKTNGYSIDILFSVIYDEGPRLVDYINPKCVKHIVDDIIIYDDLISIRDAVKEKNDKLKDNDIFDRLTVSVHSGLPHRNTNKIEFHFYFKFQLLNELIRDYSFDSIENVLKKRDRQLRFDS